MIFYFSGTGNTRWAAKRLAEETQEELIYIPDVMDGNCSFSLQKGERLGILFPVHGWRPPRLVRRFLEKLSLQTSDDTYCYALCTAGDTIAKTMDILEDDLRKKNIVLKAAFSLIMPESYVGLPFMDVDTRENELRKRNQAAKDLDVFAGIIKEKRTISWKTGETDLHKGPIPWFFSIPIGGFFVNKLVSDKPFHVVEERCEKCGICALVCPVHDIEGGKGVLPRWLHHEESDDHSVRDRRCLTCFTCYHHCPQHAIEFGRQTKKKGQYYLKGK